MGYGLRYYRASPCLLLIYRGMYMKWIQSGELIIEVDDSTAELLEAYEVVPSEEFLAHKMKGAHKLCIHFANEAKRYHNQILELYYNKDKK